MKLFKELKHTIESDNNSNFYFDRLDWATGVWIRSLCCLVEKKLEKSNKKESQMKEEKLYIGSRFIIAYAYPLDECSFLKNFKEQDVSNRETRLGYLIKYPDGYTSWSPKETFETAYREVTDSEKVLFKAIARGLN